MIRVFGRTRGGAVAAALALTMAALAAAPDHGIAVGASRSHAAQARLVFAFGREGGNIRPLTVTIDDTGMVTTSYPVGRANGPVRLSRDALQGLLTLARAEGFFGLPSQMVGHGLPDIGGRFITIHTAGHAKTVHVRFVRDAAFDQLYAVLSAVAGVGS